VWVGADKNTGRRVAIKFYAHRSGVDWALISREVEKLVFLSADRYVVQLLDVGWDTDPPYYVMEYIEHGSLDEYLRRRGILSAAEAVELFRETAVGLLHAHGKGVLHCDLKPANVMLEARHDEADVVKVLDFGIARLNEGGGGTRLTQFGTVCGTPGYMSPEQARGEELDGRSDLYGVGAILYELVTGKLPFDATTPIALLTKMLAEPLPRPTARRPGVLVPAELEALIMRALSPRREDRPPGAEAFREQLLACVPPESIRHTPRGPDTHPPASRLTPPRTVRQRGGTAPLHPARPPTPGAIPLPVSAPHPAAALAVGQTVAVARAAPPRARETVGALLVILGSAAGAIILGAILLYLLG
jgi:serine/threonine protein kinase